MAQATKENENKAVAVRRPTLWRSASRERFRPLDRPHGRGLLATAFPTLLRPERRWPVEGGLMTRMSAVDVYEEQDDVVTPGGVPPHPGSLVSFALLCPALTLHRGDVCGREDRRGKGKMLSFTTCCPAAGWKFPQANAPCQLMQFFMH